MVLTISSEHEKLVSDMVARGAYQTESDAISAAIDLLGLNDLVERRKSLLNDIELGLAEDDAGDVEVFDDDGLKAFFVDLQNRVLEKQSLTATASQT